MADLASKVAMILKREVVQLAHEPTVNFYDLAVCLSNLYETDGRELSGLSTSTRLSRRRMYYLLRVGQFLNEYDIPKHTAESLGWTKLQILARHVSGSEEALSRAHLKELLKMAGQHKALDLPKALKGKNVPDKRAVQFYLNMGARAELREALIAFGAKQKGRRLKGKDSALIKLVRAASKS